MLLKSVRNKNILKGFSLMEMMIVLLITAIIAAATAPMLNRKMLENQAANTTPWVYTSDATNDIAFNLAGKNQTATIGALKFPLKSTNGSDVNKPAMFIKTAAGKPQITFGDGDNNLISLAANNNSIYLTKHSNIGNTSHNVIIGANAKITGDNQNFVHNSVVIGSTANTTSATAVSVGHNTKTGNDSVAIGSNATADAVCATSIGSYSSATKSGAIALGANRNYRATAKGADSIAIGSGATTDTDTSIAIGRNAQTITNTHTIAIGVNDASTVTKATGKYSSAIGYNTQAIGENSIAIGNSSMSQTQDSISIGYNAKANGALGGIAIGRHAKATGQRGIAIGSSESEDRNAEATNIYTTAVGYAAKASGQFSTAIGYNAKATLDNQIVLGDINSTVYIPGRLVVDKTCVLSRTQAAIKADPNGTKGGVIIMADEYGDDGSMLMKIQRDSNQGGRLIDWYYGESHPSSSNIYLSDKRLKNVGKAFTGGLEEIKKLEVFNYTFKKDPDKTPHVGVMAQDLEKIFPKAVFKGDDGFLRIRMEDMFYALVNAVKELSNKFDLLEQKQKKIDDLEKRIENLEKKLEKLEKQRASAS